MEELNLKDIRNQLDQIDQQIVECMDARMKLCKQVADYKIANHKPVFDQEREIQKLNAVENLADDAFSKTCIRDLFVQIMTMSRRLQYGCIAQSALKKQTIFGFQPVAEIPKGQATVVYQGVEGAYSQAAMWQYFGEEVNAFHVESWRDAMDAVKTKKADYGVFPIENSTAGSVSDVYDLLVEYDNYIIGEVVLKIQHALLGLEGSELGQIKTIYSHPQALMQSAGFLEANKQWQSISMKNTAGAAKRVLEDNDPTQAAIASVYAAKVYGLKVLKEGVNDVDMNATRFIVVTNRPVFEKRAKKISLCLELPHVSGSLYNILGCFTFNNLNMTKIESRPIKDRRFEYRFFLDVEGNLEDIDVQNALSAIKAETSSFKLLGNY